MKKHYKLFIKTCCLIILSNIVVSLAYATVLDVGSTDATYNVTYRNIASGTLKQHLTIGADHQYQFSQKISSQIAFFDFAENEDSKGTWSTTAPYLQTLSYTVSGRNRLEKYDFDWQNHVVHYQKENKKGEVALTEELHDQLNCQLLLRIALENGAKEFSCPYLNGKKIKHFRFSVAGQDTITFNNKRYPVQKIIQHNPLKPSGKKTIFWISPDLSFMPLRVIQYKDNQQISIANLVEIHFLK